MYEELKHKIEEMGAYKTGIVRVEDICFDASLRKLCEMNQCGNYGKSWTCPPDVGDINDLIQEAKSYDYALVYQTVSNLEDSFDIEGMEAARVRHKNIMADITKLATETLPGKILHLAAGGCPNCEVCARKQDQPCRFPDKKLASLEAYGVYVSELAKTAGMKYINGKNTVTYFGAFFFRAA